MSEERGDRLKLVSSRPAGSDIRSTRHRDLDWTILMARAQDGDGAAYLRLLQEITPDAEWLREPSFFAWDEVSTISFDEPYAQVLLDVAGQPPRIDFTGSGFGSAS